MKTMYFNKKKKKAREIPWALTLLNKLLNKTGG